ncbi:MAG: prepilin-type N-terminal cleavage/methylation domain-containing protein [Candidatus Riflebacteria bacterium]
MKHKRIGFTLVEMMIGVLLGSTILGVAFGIWSHSVKQVARYSLRQRLQQDADRIADKLSADIKAAKAETFKVISEKPLKLEFTRYADEDEAGKVLSKDKFYKVTYTLTGNMLTRGAVSGNMPLSTAVDSIVLNRDTVSEKEQSYKEAKVDIELVLKAKTPGSGLEETLVRHTSVVIREDYYNKLSTNRGDIFAMSSEDLAKMEVKDSDSAYINDGALSLDSLKNLDDDQLAGLLEEQKEIIDLSNDKLKHINDQIKKVDSSTYFFGWFGSDDAKDLDKTRDELKKLECPDDPSKLPDVSSKERPSDQAGKYVEKLEDQIKDSQDEFAENSFGSDGKDLSEKLKSDDPETKSKAELLKRVLEMKTTDRSMKDQVEKFEKEEKKKKEKAEKKGETYTEPDSKDKISYAIDMFKEESSDSNIEAEVKAQYPNASSEELAGYISERKTERDEFIKLYESCNLGWMDDSKNEDKVKDYNARVQLKNLAENKRDLFLIKEMAMDNSKLINQAMNSNDDLSSD